MNHKNEDKRKSQLRDEFTELVREMNRNYEEFNSVDDDALIEALIYERCSLEARYKYLLGKAKKLGFEVDF